MHARRRRACDLPSPEVLALRANASEATRLRRVHLRSAVELVRRHVRRAALADHRDLDLSRVLEVVLDLACDLMREQNRGVVVDLIWLDDHADLTAGLKRVYLLHARVRRGEALERREP